MTLGERIKKMRKTLDLTQREFGERIGVKPNTIATYEIGRNEPIDAVVSLICREFNVSETWLRAGEGEMFIKKEPQPLEELLSDLLGEETVTDEDRVLVKNFLELPEASRKAVIKFVQKCADELSTPVVDAKAATTAPVTAIKEGRESLEAAEEKTPFWNGDMTDEEAHAELDRELLDEKERAARLQASQSFGSAGENLA